MPATAAPTRSRARGAAIASIRDSEPPPERVFRSVEVSDTTRDYHKFTSCSKHEGRRTGRDRSRVHVVRPLHETCRTFGMVEVACRSDRGLTPFDCVMRRFVSPSPLLRRWLLRVLRTRLGLALPKMRMRMRWPSTSAPHCRVCVSGCSQDQRDVVRRYAPALYSSVASPLVAYGRTHVCACSAL